MQQLDPDDMVRADGARAGARGRAVEARVAHLLATRYAHTVPSAVPPSELGQTRSERSSGADGSAAALFRHPPAGIASARYLPELEALRGLAIVLVFFFHADHIFAGSANLPIPWPIEFVRAGHTGVSLFFVLSAFLLSLPFLGELAGRTPLRRRSYFARRALRILPLYWSAVLVGAWLSSSPIAVRAGFYHFFFLSGLYGLNPPLWPYSTGWWSLVVEVQFYLLLPLLPYLARNRAFGGVIVVAYVITYAAFLSGWLTSNPYLRQFLGYYSLFGRAPQFAVGIGAAWFYLRQGDRVRRALARSAWWRGGGADLLLFAVLAVLAFVLVWVARAGILQIDRGPLQVWHLPEGLMWASVVLLVVLAPLRTRGVLCNRAFTALGVLSYSIYLTHVPVLSVVARHLGGTAPGWNATNAAAMVAAFAACIMVSTVTYWVIERPFLSRKTRLAA